MVCELLLEESNVQPVSTPVTVCGDIHGQVHFTYQHYLTFLRIHIKLLNKNVLHPSSNVFLHFVPYVRLSLYFITFILKDRLILLALYKKLCSVHLI